MGVRIRIKSGPEEGRVHDFADDKERIVIGRNPERCDLCLPPDLTVVGREHLALRRQLGRYRLILNASNPVFIDGRPALDGMELPMWSEIQLGTDGPVLLVETLLAEGLPQTMWGGQVPKTPHSIIEEAAKRAAANRRLVLITIVGLVLAAGAVAWIVLSGRKEAAQREEALRTEVRGLEGKLSEVNKQAAADRAAAQATLDQRLGVLQGALDTLRPDVQGLRSAMAGIGPRMRGLEQRVEDLKPMLQEHLRTAAKSVVLVLGRNAKGDETPLATAWVAGKGLLATNAHVAEAFDKLAPGNELIARSSGENPVDVKITGVTIHPGYKAFQDLWRNHAPTRVQLGGGLQRLNQVPSCDVATMTVSDPDKLGPPLRLASQDVLHAINSGDVVGFVGFPLEDMAGGAVNLQAPSATTQVGHVTGVTNFFLGRTQPKRSLLVQHSMTTVGGTSGSPVVDAKGRVIAIHNAGNFIFVGGKRVPGADVNFAQRADLIRELMAGEADEAQTQRTKMWEKGIAQFGSLRDAARRVALDYLDKRMAAMKEKLGLEPKLVSEETGLLKAEEGGVSLFTKPFSVKDTGWYVFFAWSTTAENIDLLLLRAKEDQVILKETEPNPFPLVPANADKPVDIRVVVGAGSRVQHGEFVLRVYHFPAPKKADATQDEPKKDAPKDDATDTDKPDDG